MDAAGVKYVFSTVHKFKGLEMNHVRLLDDFNFAGVHKDTYPHGTEGSTSQSAEDVDDRRASQIWSPGLGI